MANNLKKEENKIVESFLENHPTAKMIANYKKWLEFKEGDVLIRERSSLEEGEIDMVSADCRVPKKFKVMHIDKLGFPWVKNINVRGGLGTKLYNLSESPKPSYLLTH
jgi:hypothetical protein